MDRRHIISQDDRDKLHELSAGIRRLAESLTPATEVDADFVRSIIRMRRLRDETFGASLFADPAWDMMLDLLAAQLENRHVSVSSLCLAAAVPPTTALRWIALMEREGVIQREADPSDRRRVNLSLDAGTTVKLIGFLKASRSLAAPLI